MANKIKLELTSAQKTLFRTTAQDREQTSNEGMRARTEYAAQFGDMLLKTIPINSTVRGIYDVRTKPQGAEMRFLIEPNDTLAWVMSKIGQFARNWIEGDEVFVPVDIFQTSVYYSLDYAEDADYDVASIALNKLNDAILRLEETEGWMLLRAAVNNAPAAQQITIANLSTGTGQFSKHLFNAMLLYFEKEGKTLDVIYLPATGMADVRLWTTTTIDPVTQRQIFVAGGLNQIWNIPLVPIPLIRYYLTVDDKKSKTKVTLDRLFNPADKFSNANPVWNGTQRTAYAAGTLECCYGISKTDLGILAIKTPLRTYDDPTAIVRWEQGILARERIGFMIIDSERIVRGLVDRTSAES